MKQGKYANNPPGGGYQKALVIVKNTSCNMMMGALAEGWDYPPYTVLMFFQTSTKEVLHTDPINYKIKMVTPE